jgi:diguanylate cyclase (GGDEF)-like protein/PAS domain S-box-containing protein
METAIKNAILECAGAGIYGIDRDGMTTFANAAAIRLTGWPLDESLGKLQHSLIHHSRPDGTPYPREACPIDAALRKGEFRQFEEEVFWRKNGTSFPVSYTTTPLQRDGVLIGAVIIFQDITEDKKRQHWDQNYRKVLELVAACAPLAESLAALSAAVGECQHGLTVSIDAYSPGSPAAAENNLPPCWSRTIVAGSGAILGSFQAYQSGSQHLPPGAEETLELACGLASIAIANRNLLDQLAHQATHDLLTGLANRTVFADRLDQALAQAKRFRSKVAVYMIDLDRFKDVSDAYGHRAADSFLVETVNRLQRLLEDGDTLARVGEAELALMIPRISDTAACLAVASSMVESLHRPAWVDGNEFVGSLSVGIGLYPEHGEAPVTLQKHAHEAMYRANAMGGNRFEVFDPAATSLAAEALKMETRLREALEKKWFYLEYQPQFAMNGELMGMEALVRLKPPGQNALLPGKFIPIAEESGLIVPLGEWVLWEACRQGMEWSEQGYAPFRMGVNFSARQLAERDFVDQIISVLEETGFPPSLLELELTESCLIASAADSIQQLNRLRKIGVEISIDDFGTGYSSLSRLHLLPVTAIKIDKTFIDRLTTGAGGLETVAAIVSLATQLGFRVTAEGVETSQQLEALIGVGSVIVQGYLAGRPERAAKAKRHLSRVATAVRSLPKII